MKLEALRTRTGDACLSDRRLDALLAGELDDAARGEAELHLGDCARCAARRQELAGAGAAFLEAHPPAAPVRQPVRLALRRRAALWASAGLAAAAALLLLVRTPSEEVRSKGTGSVGFFVRHGESVRRGGPGERVMPGDALRFVITQREPSYVAVLSRDAAGQASVYFPAAQRALRVEAGVDRALDSSVILDDVLGSELLIALRCSAPIELAPLRAQLEATTSEPTWPAGCEVERLTLLKVWTP
jgi:hypothetical protein